MNRRRFFALSLPALLGGAVWAAEPDKPDSQPSSRRGTAAGARGEIGIRPATADDVRRMVELSDRMRTRYARYSPLFLAQGAGASEKQQTFFQAQLTRDQNISLVAEEGGQIEGFIIAGVTAAPPVYDPGGQVCLVDDFAVSSPEKWRTVGPALWTEATAQAKGRGAVLSVVVCGHLDEPKRAMLRAGGAAIASEWYTHPIA